MWAEINKNLLHRPINCVFKQEDHFIIIIKSNHGHDFILY